MIQTAMKFRRMCNHSMECNMNMRIFQWKVEKGQLYIADSLLNLKVNDILCCFLFILDVFEMLSFEADNSSAVSFDIEKVETF